MQIRDFSVFVLGWVFVLLSSTSVAWIIEEDFENVTTGSGQLCGKIFWSSSWKSSISTDEAASGTKSCKFAISQGGNGIGGGVAFLQQNVAFVPQGGEMWVRFRLFMPIGFDYGVYGEGDTLKFIRVEFRGDSRSTYDNELLGKSKTNAFGTLVSKHPCNSYSDCWELYGDVNDKPILGSWDTYEMYYYVDDISIEDGGQAFIRMWRNGTWIGDMNKNPTTNHPDQEVATVSFFTYWNGGAPQTQHLYFDDLVITNERPAAKDSQGNAYIGMGEFVAGTPPVTVSPPNPPSLPQ